MAKHNFCKRSVSKIYHIPQKNRRLRRNKGRLPKANEIAQTDVGHGSGRAQLERSPSSYTRNDRFDGISCVLTEVKQCLKATKLEIDYHEGNAHTPHVIALNRNWKKEMIRRKRGATNQTDPGTPSQTEYRV